MYAVKISPIARKDLANLKEYLELMFDEEISARVIREVLSSIRKFEEYPLMGRPLTNIIDVHTDYLYFVIEKNYIFYRIENKSVEIIRILDTRRDFIKILFGNA